MKIVLVFSFLILAGCASHEFKGTDLKMNVVSYMDPVEKAIVYDYEYENGILVYKKLIEEERINSIAKWSCFGSADSVNYLDITAKEVKYLRSLHVDQLKTITYLKEDINVNKKYIRKYREISSDTLEINSKRCLIKGDKLTYYVISEIYTQK